MRKYFAMLVIVLSFITISAPAYAYFDPNASSLLFQILAPLTAAITSVWLLGVGKIGTLIASIKRKLTFRAKRAAAEQGTNTQAVRRDVEQD